MYAVLLALFIGIGGVIGWLFDIDSISYPFQPIHATISNWFTIGVPAFILSLAPPTTRPHVHSCAGCSSQAGANGIIVGLCTFVTFVIVSPGGTGPQLGAEDSVDLTPDQTQAAHSRPADADRGSPGVLVGGRRPYNWWKIVLLSVSAGAYVLIFLVPWSLDMFPTRRRPTRRS